MSIERRAAWEVAMRQLQHAMLSLGMGWTGFVALCVLLLSVSGCQSSARLLPAAVMAQPAEVFQLMPTRPWHVLVRPSVDPPQVERWTRHGIFLDTLTFVGGLPAGAALRVTRRRSPGYIPFDPELGSHGVEALIEEFYRRLEGLEDFRILAREDVVFLATEGHRFDYEFRDRYELLWRGRAYVAILDARFYMIQYDTAALHYFEDGLPEMEAMVQQAIVR